MHRANILHYIKGEVLSQIQRPTHYEPAFLPSLVTLLHYTTTQLTLHYTTNYYYIIPLILILLLLLLIYTNILSQWRFATGPAAAVAALVVALAVVALAVASVVAVTVAPLLGRVRGVLLVQGDLRLIRALEPGALDGPDICPHLGGDPLGIVRVIGRCRG
jgi:hypothetical protein